MRQQKQMAILQKRRLVQQQPPQHNEMARRPLSAPLMVMPKGSKLSIMLAGHRRSIQRRVLRALQLYRSVCLRAWGQRNPLLRAQSRALRKTALSIYLLQSAQAPLLLQMHSIALPIAVQMPIMALMASMMPLALMPATSSTMTG